MHRVLHILFIISLSFSGNSQFYDRVGDTLVIFNHESQLKVNEINSILNDSNLSESQKADSILNLLKVNYQSNPWFAESTAKLLYSFAEERNLIETEARALFYLGKAQIILNKDSDGSFIRAARLFDELNIIDNRIECLNILVKNAVNRSDESNYLKFKKQLYSSVKDISSTTRKGQNTYFMFHQNLGGVFMQRDELDSALIHYNFALQYASKLNDETFLAQCYLNIGNLYDLKDEFVKAFEYWLKCKEIAKRNDNFILQSKIAMAIGRTYVHLGEYNSSIGPFKEANNLALKSDNKQLQILALINLAKSQFYQSEFKQSISTLELGEVLINSGIGDNLKFEIYLSKGACYMNLKKYSEAQKMFELAQSESKKYGNEIRNPSLLINIATLAQARKNYEKALKLFSQVRASEIEANSYGLRSYASRAMYEIYGLKGDRSRALEMLENYTIERDTIDQRDAKSKIIAMDLESDFQLKQIEDSIAFANRFAIQSAQSREKDATLKRQKAELEVKRVQQYLLFGGIGFLGLFLLFLYNRFRVSAKQNKIIEKQKDKNLYLSQKILEQDQQLILGETAKTVAHELNSPLGAIKAGAEGLHYLMEELINNLLPASSQEDLDVASHLSSQQETGIFVGMKKKQEKAKTIQKKISEKFGLESASSSEIASELSELHVFDPDEKVINFLVSCQDRQPIYKLAKCIGQIKMISETTISATNKSADVVSSVREALDFQTSQDFEDVRLDESISSVVTIIESNINEKGTFKHEIDPEVYMRSVNEFKIFQLWYNLIIFIVEEAEESMEIKVNASENEICTQVRFTLNQAIQNKTLNEHHYKIIMDAKRDSNDLRMGIVKYLLSENNIELHSEISSDQTVFTIDFPAKKA